MTVFPCHLRTIIRSIVLCASFSCLFCTGSLNLSVDRTNCSHSSVFQIISTNSTDHYLYLIVTEINRPPSAIILKTTDANVKASVNCTGFENSNHTLFHNSVILDEQYILQSYGFIFHRLCTYNDFMNEVIPKSVLHCNTFLGHNLNWNLISFNENPNENGSVNIKFQANRSNHSWDHFGPDGFISVTFSVYEQRKIPNPLSYYEFVPLSNLFVEIIVKDIIIPFEFPRISPVFLIFSNHSMMDEEDFLEKKGYILNSDTGPLGKLQTTSIYLGDRISKSGEVITTYPRGFLQFVPSFWSKQSETAQLTHIGLRQIINSTSLKTTSYHYSLPFAFYGKRFEQVHSQSTANHCAIREQFIYFGTPGGDYYSATNFSSWMLILGSGQPDYVEDASSSTHISLIVLFVLLITLLGVGGSAYSIRQYRIRHSRSPVYNVLTSEPNVVDEIVEPYQFHKLDPETSRQRSQSNDKNQSSRVVSTDQNQHLLPENPPSYGSLLSSMAISPNEE